MNSSESTAASFVVFSHDVKPAAVVRERWRACVCVVGCNATSEQSFLPIISRYHVSSGVGR